MAKSQAKTKSAPAKPVPAKKKGYWLDILYIFILMVVVITTYNKVYDKKLWLGGDNAVYYITGKAIADGEGYTNINSPTNSPATWYPPGYPFISAIVMKVFGEKIEVMNKANGFFLFGSLIFLYLISIRLTKNKHLSFVITIISALNMHILNYSIIAMSEIPFLFTSLGAIYFLIRMEKQSLPFKDYNFWLFFFLLVLSYYIRPTGLAVIGGVTLYFLFTRKWKITVIVIAGFLLCVFPWYLRNKSVGGARDTSNITRKNYYRPELGGMKTADWFKRIDSNVTRYVTLEIPSAMLGYSIDNNATYQKPTPKDKKWFTGLFWIALGIAGFFCVREYKWLVVFYLAGTFAILLICPLEWFGIRLMLIVVPLIYLICILAVYDGISWVSKKININEKIRVSFLPFIFLLFILVLKDGITNLVNRAKGTMPPGYEQYFEIAKWAKLNLPQSSVVVCRKPELFYLYSGCRTVNYQYSLNADSLISNMKANKATHVVLDELGFASTGRYLQPALQKNSEKFKLISHTQDPDPHKPQTYLYEIHYDCGYQGEMKNGKRNGKGISRYADGTAYDGYWKDDIKEGNGIFIWPGGLKFEGLFSKNLRNGPGVLYINKGKILKTTWINDTINGYGKLYDTIGNLLHEGLMKNNVFVDSKYPIW